LGGGEWDGALGGLGYLGGTLARCCDVQQMGRGREWGGEDGDRSETLSGESEMCNRVILLGGCFEFGFSHVIWILFRNSFGRYMM